MFMTWLIIRVPCLSFDFVFKNVPYDETVCGYADCVKSLISYLHSAMLQAQKNSIKSVNMMDGIEKVAHQNLLLQVNFLTRLLLFPRKFTV